MTAEKLVVVDDEVVLFDQVEVNFINVLEETGCFETMSYDFSQDS